nr:hypothetical protein [Angustibacter aerolatus]
MPFGPHNVVLEVLGDLEVDHEPGGGHRRPAQPRLPGRRRRQRVGPGARACCCRSSTS